MADTDVLVSELDSASAINTNDLLLMTQPDGDAQTGYASRKGTVLQTATKMLKGIEFTTDLPHFTDKTVLGALEELSTGKANTSGEYNGLISGQANALKPSARLENTTPYLFRPSYSNGYGYETLIGGTCGVNQLVDTGDTSVNTISGHKYLTRINGVESIIAGGSAVSINDSSEDNVIDLTTMFGTTIADYVYTLESGTAGAGITWLKNNGFFTADYYPYNAGGLLSVKTSKKINRDADNNIIGEYTLNGSRKVHRVFGTADEDSFNSYDGQISPGGLHWVQCTVDNIRNGSAITSMLEVKNTDDGWVSNTPCLTMENGRLVIYMSENSLADFKTEYANLEIVYELATPFDETVNNPELRGILKLDSDNNLYYYGDTCSDFTNPMIVDGNGTEQFVDGRTVEMPVGHETIYVDNSDKTKLDNLPDISNDGNGTYLVTQTNGQMSLDKYPIPNPPTTDGSYRLEVTVTDGVPAYTWEVIS